MQSPPRSGHRFVPGRSARLLRRGLSVVCLFGLYTCAQPEVLRATMAEPTMPAAVSDGPRAPLPLIAVPTGEPPIVRESGASGTETSGADIPGAPRPIPLNVP